MWDLNDLNYIVVSFAKFPGLHSSSRSQSSLSCREKEERDERCPAAMESTEDKELNRAFSFYARFHS